LTSLALVAQGALAGSSATEDQYTFTRLAGPDRGDFLPRAINAKGQMVGERLPREPDLKDLSHRAVLRDADGRFTAIEPPDGRFTALLGINARGQIVGSAINPKESFGFVREVDGRFVRLRLPEFDEKPNPVEKSGKMPFSVMNPVATAISDEGAILASCIDRRKRGRDYVQHEDGRIRILPVSGSGSYTGLNSRGQVVGNVFDIRGTRHGILLDDKNKVTLIDWPKTTLTEARAINDQGVIVGIYLNRDPRFGLHRSFVRDPQGKLAAFDFPKANETQATGINNAGHIIGRYQDHEGTHGFLAVLKGRR
jgi:hypothetical protein